MQRPVVRLDFWLASVRTPMQWSGDTMEMGPFGFQLFPGYSPTWVDSVYGCPLPVAAVSGRVMAGILRMTFALNQQVLVLNRLWQAVNICSVRRALSLLFEGQAQVVYGDNDGDFQTFDFNGWRDFSSDRPPEANEPAIHTVSFRLRLPRVILLMAFDRVPRQEVKFTRHNIFERDKNMCQYCGRVLDRKDLNLDHVVPRDRGGPTTWENIVCSCIPCNTRKSNRTPAEAGLRLVRKPKRPKWRPFVQVTFGGAIHDDWKHFLDLAYWNVELGGDPS